MPTEGERSCSHWPSPPPLSTLSPHPTSPHPSKRALVGGNPAPQVAARRAGEHHGGHVELRALPHLHVDVEAPRPCTMLEDMLSSPTRGRACVTFHRTACLRRRRQAPEARRGRSHRHSPLLQALTALTSVSAPPSLPMACPRPAVSHTHHGPLRGYKNSPPPPLLSTPLL